MDTSLSRNPQRKVETSIRPLEERDLPSADRVLRLAFGTYFAFPEPMSFMGDANYSRTRWLADPHAAFCAEADGEVVGSGFVAQWGSVGIVGPITVHPQRWDRGIGKQLMEPLMACLSAWRTRHAGLFTFADSPKHLGLYQKFGFQPRFLTMVMSKPVEAIDEASDWFTFSELRDSRRPASLQACRELTGTIYEGLDLSREILSVQTQDLGETILLADASGLLGLAICHCGPGTEAGSDTCYIKFAAVRPQPAAASAFHRLLYACEDLAASRGFSRMVAGVNTARHEAYGCMLERGFRTEFQGVAMQKPNEAGYNRPGVYVADDWR